MGLFFVSLDAFCQGVLFGCLAVFFQVFYNLPRRASTYPFFVEVVRERNRRVFASSVAVAPVVEELAFRAFLLPEFVAEYGLFLGLFFTNCLFSAFHFLHVGRRSRQYVALFVSGCVFSFSFLVTNNLFVPIVAHAFTNFALAFELLRWP